jgi:hypothetical protein
MGLGGFVMHARSGLATPYLGTEFMDVVRDCVDLAEQEGLRAWLYDEDRWPSGFAGGMATVDPRARAKQLLWTRFPYGVEPPAGDAGAFGQRAGKGALLARYHVGLRDGVLADYRRMSPGEAEPAGGVVWYAYLETMQPAPWYNNQAYADTLSHAAVECFVELTHERYAAVVGGRFGSTVPAIFTDEPQVIHKQSLAHAGEPRDVILPWTDDLLASYRAAYGDDLADRLPELFWQLPAGQASTARYRYHDHLCERFASAFVDTVGTWCRRHGLLLTGHLMHESTLGGQTAALGEVMRCYRGFDLPGIDMLCDWHEYTTAKQAQSVARQYARPGVLSELYGVTNWDFDFAGHKAQGDWQAALGVTARVHHLAWVSMAGEAKRDYPASIGEQSPWWPEYHLVEDHFARLNTVLTRGRPLVRVGVVHPIESYWLCAGPLDQTAVERDERERAFADLARWLLFGLVDFDFIAESLLPELCPLEPATSSPAHPTRSEPALRVGAMCYDAVIVPGLRTIRTTTLERLERFRNAGGTLIFAGEVPTLVDAAPSGRATALAARCRRLPLARGPLLGALAPLREVAAWLPDGRPADVLLHHARADGDRRYVFLCNTDKHTPRPGIRIALDGSWKVTLLDTLTGAVGRLPARAENGRTWIEWDFPAHGSLLVELSPWNDAESLIPLNGAFAAERLSSLPMIVTAMHGSDSAAVLADPVPITLAEPNVLLLDQAAYRLNDEEWQPADEILRIDTRLRRRLGFPLRTQESAQPWAQAAGPAPVDTVSLRFALRSDVGVAGALLALEDAGAAEVRLDDQVVPRDVTGWWVDQSIQTIWLPPLPVGVHELVITRPFGASTALEWCYLLGDFGVEVRGRHSRIVAPPHELAFGDWTRQGLPFYGGNVTYHCTIEGDGGPLALRVPKFKAPVLSVAMDGRRAGTIAFAPFQLDLGALAPGTHTLAITAYGNRVNTFGALHNANERTTWYGPPAWRTTGDDWAYEYQLRPMGILAAPQLVAYHPGIVYSSHF